MWPIPGSGAEAQVVVPVARVVPVAVGGTAVPAVVVPAATPFHAVRARYFPAPEIHKPSFRILAFKCPI